jgi:predicted amidohydrolase
MRQAAARDLTPTHGVDAHHQQMSRENPGVVDFPNVMSKFIMFGMPLGQVIACATVNAARAFPAFDDRGTLNIGAPADVAIMELREGTFDSCRQQFDRPALRNARAAAGSAFAALRQFALISPLI